MVGGSVTSSILTLYSSSLNLQVLGIPWSRARGIVVSTAVIAAGSLATLFWVDFTESLTSFLSVLLVVFAPWGGVFVADTLMRRCRYDADALHDATHGSTYWYTRGIHAAGLAAPSPRASPSPRSAPESALWTGPSSPRSTATTPSPEPSSPASCTGCSPAANPNSARPQPRG
ncbi:cytosine permease [Yinghuangia aomiensis]